MSVVAFNYATWILRYPEFQTVTEPLAQEYWAEAGLYVSNTDGSAIAADPVTFQPRLSILNMLTAHLATLNWGVNGQAASPLVGRVTDAAQGSVRVSASIDGIPGSAAWFAQTKYGLAAWAAMAPYRTATYRASPGRFAQRPGPYGYGARRPY